MHAAFLQDIREHPDDNTPRLVYADWLEDEGDSERAEFIRAGCWRAALPAGHADDKGLASREAELLARNEARWRAALPQLEGITWDEEFTRGFVEGVFTETAGAFLRHAPALFAAAPVRRVKIGLVNPVNVAALARSRHLLALEELNLGNHTGIDAAGVRELSSSPNLANLSVLLLHYNPLGDEGLITLAWSEQLPRLRELYVSGIGAGDRGASTVAGGRLRDLTDLDLRDNQIGDEGVEALANWNWAGDRLQALYLVNNRIGERGANSLAMTAHLPNLAQLYLNHNAIGDSAARAFARSPHRAALRDLDLRSCGITDEGALALADSPLVRQLQMLWLTDNPIRRRDTWRVLRERYGDRLIGKGPDTGG
jgi:uncharacterized protein (TIGR02996 family)